ncbi:MAG TPA: HNH endonuclease [Solirubrobacterales bacterium]|nr:HNH endonuclease [Solirubrobacterales bacterium]
MSAARLLWKPANKSTLKVLRGEFRGQYHVVLGRTDKITEFFGGLPRLVDHKGLRIDFWTDPTGSDESELAPWWLTVRRMSEDSARPMEWYIGSQQPGSTHPAWRPGVGPRSSTQPDEDRLVLLRLEDDRFVAGWLRRAQIRRLPAALATLVAKRSTGVASLSPTDRDVVLQLLGHQPEAAEADKEEAAEEPPIDQWTVPADPEEPVYEGQPVLGQHYRRERKSSRLRRRMIEAAGGHPTCAACGFDFEATYGERGHGFIECHHTIPISEIDPGTPTRIGDLELLCANCHRMIHASREWITVEELREILTAAQAQ